ncbi:hydroxyacylglutathione hydrolase [Acidisoma silvae]|uniref:Hydroxyacylglutathione hydrolase n=1 Tax=Acidisoma silvae TaxID=2802396 RepID=A0A964E0K4_9PROT|nr:hydroxyacylglutathione hydrolase [Acidisoma silvae]MCB8877259.1 hydroxyacylglutathione hydrolase [Acidisoma silvae]
MALIVIPVPMLSDNYAWLLRDEATGKLAFIDPAESEAASNAVEAMGGALDTVLLTHHHNDHIGGAEALRSRFGAQIVGAALDSHRLPPLDQSVRDGEAFDLFGHRVEVIDTPGHTVGHISYFLPDGPMLFCGDTMFSLGCGRMFEGTPAQFFDSFRKIAALPPRTLIYAGHEYTQSNARFALSIDPDNLALRDKAAEVDRLRASGQPTLPVRLEDELPVNPYLLARDAVSFGRIRQLKDEFKA